MARHVLCVLSNATEGADEEFNRWYDEQHLGDVLRVPGFRAAERFKLSETQLGAGDLPYRYLALYEVETDDLAAAARALTSRDPAEMPISDTLDRGRTVAWFYTPVRSARAKE